MDNEKVFLKPINLIIDEINNASKNGVFLVGEEGSGKTTTLLRYVEESKNTNNPVMDITLLSICYMNIHSDFIKLFQVCIVLQKMLLYIKENYLRCYVEHFLLFNTKISNIQNDIVSMYNFNKYQIKETNINEIILNKPEFLIEEFLNIAIKYLKFDNLTVIIDNFDVEKPYINIYQNYIYNMLKKYLRVVATISDPFCINNPEKIKNLAQENTIITMNYNRNIAIVKQILDKYFANKSSQNIIYRRVSFMFSDATINELIVKTNGNLYAMIFIMKKFFEQINEINTFEYDNYLLNIIDYCLNLETPLINRKKKRKLLI